MRKLLVLAALVAVALVPAVAQAGPFIASDKVQVGDILSLTDYNNSNFGGPFLADNQTVGSPDFLTFCVEAQESISFGVAVLKVAGISEKAYWGGIGPAGDPLDERTAYLFTKYRVGPQHGRGDQQRLPERHLVHRGRGRREQRPGSRGELGGCDGW